MSFQSHQPLIRAKREVRGPQTYNLVILFLNLTSSLLLPLAFHYSCLFAIATILTASDGEADDNFGVSVSIDGDYALTGAYGDDVGGDSDEGSAYIFFRSGTDWASKQS